MTKSLSTLVSLKWAILFISMGLGIATGLFYYGIHAPFYYRLRGDAWTYMDIAHHFTSLREALHYIGVRTPGFPIFDYLFLFFDPNSTEESRIIHLCLTLFIFHELTMLWCCFIAVKCKLFTSSSLYFGLFCCLLIAYPAMVMHTTTPLTDVFGADLLWIGFSLFAFSSSKTPSTLTLCLGLISGSILGYAILVRPAYWPGVIGFLTVYALMTCVNRCLSRPLNIRQPIMMCTVTLLTLAIMILPVMNHCKSRYHTLCLQDPNTFNALEHMKVGLGSARTPWTYALSPQGIVPSYPDAFLSHHFAQRCHIHSVLGHLNDDNTNLLSCFYHAPHLTVFYFIKKITGLFDTFRMTPYTETITPVWYLWLSRFFSSLAFLGFWVLLWEGAQGIYRLMVYHKPVSTLSFATFCFCVLQVSVHSVLHVEERFALPWIPFCLIALCLKIKEIQNKNYPLHLRRLWLLFALLVMLGYFIQVLVWDHGMSMTPPF